MMVPQPHVDSTTADMEVCITVEVINFKAS